MRWVPRSIAETCRMRAERASADASPRLQIDVMSDIYQMRYVANIYMCKYAYNLYVYI